MEYSFSQKGEVTEEHTNGENSVATKNINLDNIIQSNTDTVAFATKRETLALTGEKQQEGSVELQKNDYGG